MERKRKISHGLSRIATDAGKDYSPQRHPRQGGGTGNVHRERRGKVQGNNDRGAGAVVLNGEKKMPSLKRICSVSVRGTMFLVPTLLTKKKLFLSDLCVLCGSVVNQVFAVSGFARVG